MSMLTYDDRAIIFNTLGQFYELKYVNFGECPKELQQDITALAIAVYSFSEAKTVLVGHIERFSTRTYDDGDPFIKSTNHSTATSEDNLRFTLAAEAILANTKRHHLASFEQDALRNVVAPEMLVQFPAPLTRKLYPDHIRFGRNADQVVDFTEWLKSSMNRQGFLGRTIWHLLDIAEEFSLTWWKQDYESDAYLSSHYYNNQVTSHLDEMEDDLKAAWRKQHSDTIRHELRYAYTDMLFPLSCEGIFTPGSKVEKLRQDLVSKILIMRAEEDAIAENHEC